MRKFKFFVNLIKCVFIIQFVEFLKFIINNYNVFINFCKIKFIRIWFYFISLRKLQIFLNFANFYQRFIEYYAKITRSLTKLLKKNVNNKQSDLFLYNKIARVVTIMQRVNIFICVTRCVTRHSTYLKNVIFDKCFVTWKMCW